jgi:dienelactone hydrolase
MRRFAAFFISAIALAQNVREIHFYSENVQCYGKMFLPAGFSADGKVPGVVLAPGWGETAASVEKTAAAIAEKGMVAMAIDYRGWGKSGGYIYLAENIRYDDRLRFSQHTAKVRIRRRRLIPEDQVDDIRNAISYLQGEPGVDRTRIGVWGAGMSGGHAMVVAGIDPRIKAVVTQTPVIEGRDAPRKLSRPAYEQTQIKLARADSAAAAAMSSNETRIAVAEYHPFWFVSQIPQTVAVLFVVGQGDGADAAAASKILKGPAEVKTIDGAARQTSAAEWFLKYL